MAPKTSPIVVSGSIAIDRIMHFSGTYANLIQPDKLDSLAISVLLDELSINYGGVGANIAYSLALLGETPVLLGSAGHDATEYMNTLSRAGVDISSVAKSKLYTATFNVITDGNQSQIGGFFPGAMFDSSSLTLEPWKDKKPVVVISPQDPKAMKRQVRQCRQWDLRLCYDAGQQVSNLPAEDLVEGIDAAEILILNEYEFSALSKKTGHTAESIKSRVPIVITTLGKDGSLIEGEKVPDAIHVGIAPPRREADPTGAGDAFRAGLLYGLVRGWPLKTCGQLGAVTGSFALEQAGTQTHHFALETVSQRYVESFNEPLPRE